MAATLAGGGYFFAEKYENNNGLNGLKRGLFANLLQSSEQWAEEIPLEPIAYEAYRKNKNTDTSTEIIKNLKTEERILSKECAVKSSEKPLHESVIVNEIAWMGTTDGANNEWIELRNVSNEKASIGGWTLQDKDTQINLVFPAQVALAPRGFYVLARDGANIPEIDADMVYSGSLRNSDETLSLFDSGCRLQDEVIALDDWPAGDNKEKKTMERGTDLSWHTSQAVHGTPWKENSQATITMTMTMTTTSTATTSANIVVNTPKVCTSTANNIPLHTVLINEVAWAGTAADKTSHEWIELRNTTGDKVNLNGWKFTNKDENINVVFDTNDFVDIYSYYLLERTDDDAVLGIEADKIFVSAVRNSDEFLRLIDNRCNMIDEVVAENGNWKEWPAGTASPDYRTAERSADLTWHTYSGSGTNSIFGTPRADNSPVIVSSGSFSNDSGSSPPPPSPLPPLKSGPILISEIMVGIDGNADYEFVEIYNPNSFDITLTEWTMKKKSSSGSESTLVAASRFENKIIKTGKYLLLAQDGGYTGSIIPDIKWPSSYSLAYTNNTVEIFNADGTKIDEIIWTEIPKGKSFERDSWTGNQFYVQDAPNPQNSNN